MIMQMIVVGDTFDEHFFVEMERTTLMAILLRLCPAGPGRFQCHHHSCHSPILYFLMQSDNLPPASESTEANYDKGDDDTGNAKDPQDIDKRVLPPEEVLVEEFHPHCHLCNHEISGECNE